MAIYVQNTVFVGKKRGAGQLHDESVAGRTRHVQGCLLDVEGKLCAGSGCEAAGTCERIGSRLRGKVARCAASGSVGRYKSPFCPQADRATTQAAAVRIFTIILVFDMAEL